MNLNSHKLRLSGTVELPEEPAFGHDYHVSVTGSITKVSKTDNQDGTYDLTHTLELIAVELLDDKGRTMIAKDRRSDSKKWRSQVCAWALEHCPDEDPDVVYRRMMSGLRHHGDRILNWLHKMDEHQRPGV